MNFFQAQAKAKRSTLLLVLLFTLAVAGLVLLTNIVVFVAVTYLEYEDIGYALTRFYDHLTPQIVLVTSLSVVGLVLFGSLSMLYQLSAGGSVVAFSLGGQKIPSTTTHFQYRQLLNVVEEMAIASGIAVPPVYIIPDSSINAFAAGHNSDDVVIGVTQGLVDLLDREEMQGVIAHEFSHIFNGDMRLNIRLTGVLNGILMIGLVGRFILRMFARGSSSSSRSRSRDKDSGGGAVIVVLLVAVAFLLIGYVGTFIGNIIKANISRKREYLADATAVQYTRYPKGIAGALKKIGSAASGSHLTAPSAATYSHLYFAQGISSFFEGLMATHPPLEKRIRAIEPSWNGIYPKVERQKFQARQSSEPKQAEKSAVMGAAAAGIKLQDMGKPTKEHILYAQNFLEGLDQPLKDQLADPLGAQTLVLALLSEEASSLRKRQWDMATGVLHKELQRSYTLIQTVERRHYIHLVNLMLPALKNMTISQYRIFKALLIHFITIDKKVTLFEWSLQHITVRPLERAFGLERKKRLIHYTLGAVKEDTELLFSMLAQMQYPDESQAQAVFEAAKKAVGATALAYWPKERITLERFDAAVANIEIAKVPIKKRILEGAVTVMHSDAKLSAVEIEMIHALATIMQLPLPPLDV